MNSRVKWSTGQRRAIFAAQFIATLTVALLATIILSGSYSNAAVTTSLQLVVHKEQASTSTFAPLEQVSVDVTPYVKGLKLQVRDASGHRYVDVAYAGPGQSFRLEGALGTHQLDLVQGSKVLLSRALELDASTEIACANPLFNTELRRLAGQLRSSGTVSTVEGKVVRMLSTDLRESRYINGATRLFETDVKSGLDLFLASQKTNGLVFSGIQRDDHFDPFTQSFPGVSPAHDMFGDEFTARTADGRWVFERSPSYADVESMAVSWAHEVWQATGDDSWLAGVLPRLEKGLRYLQSDPLRWSTEIQLVKRGFTLDAWALQNPLVSKLQSNGGLNKSGWFDGAWISRDSPMGIAHGDNTAFYEAATLLARMYAHLGMHDSASTWTQSAEALRVALDKTSWNGTFYRHYVRLVENPIWKQLETNESRQLSMSNPFAITRGAATHAQALSIVREYQRRFEKSKGQSLAEWSTMDPPFTNGFGPVGAYSGANGGLSPIVAGPLAQAAFEHGVESYGANILRRIFELQKRHNRLHGFYYPTLRSAAWQPEEFHSVDLRTVANRHLRGDQPAGFIDHPQNDLRAFPVGHQTFLGKPFDVIDPKENGGRAAVVLWGAGSPGPRETTVSGIGMKARSIYFLHSAGNIRRQSRVGEYVLNYADGSKVRIPLVVGRNIGSWWAEGDAGEWRVAWRGKNPHVSVIATGVWGWDNNQPDKEISSITIRASGLGRVQLLGIAFSTGPVQYDHGEVESDQSVGWAAGVVYKGAVEGLAGVVDKDRLLEHVAVSPRWIAAGETQASVVVRYAASRGYVAYKWEHHPAERTESITFTGSGRRFDFHVLVPEGQNPRQVTLNGKKLRYRTEVVEGSSYADFSLEALTSGVVEVSY
jgi:hypothetical protein